MSDDCKHLKSKINQDGSSYCTDCFIDLKSYQVWWADESMAMTSGRRSALIKAALRRKKLQEKEVILD